MDFNDAMKGYTESDRVVQHGVSENLLNTENKDAWDINFDEEGETDVPIFYSKRWLLAFLGLLSALIAGIYKANISIAVVCMAHRLPANGTQKVVPGNETWNSSYTEPSSLETSAQCKMESVSDFYAKEAEFTWSKNVQSLVISGYYYGFILVQIPGGWFADKYGAKHLISAGLAINALFNLVTPVLARWNIYSVVITRMLVGVSAGLITPAWFTLMSKWALAHERSRFIAAFMGGQQLGYIIGYATSGVLCAHGFDNGWGSIFYVHGICGVLFVMVWLSLVSSTPQEHSTITQTELRLLSKHLGQVKGSQKLAPLTVPWREIVTSPAVWSVFIVHTCDNWIYYLIATCLPLFLEEVLMLDIQSNGFYSALPFITNTLGLLVASLIADFVISKAWVSRTTTRKIFQISGQVLGASFLIGSSYVTCDKRQIVISLIGMCMFVEAFGVSSGYSGNFVDMAPRYVGLLYAISNTLATIPGMFAPLAVAKLTRNGTSGEWQMVFYMAVGFALVGCLIYGLFSSSEPVSWANPAAVELNAADKPLNGRRDIEMEIVQGHSNDT